MDFWLVRPRVAHRLQHRDGLPDAGVVILQSECVLEVGVEIRRIFLQGFVQQRGGFMNLTCHLAGDGVVVIKRGVDGSRIFFLEVFKSLREMFDRFVVLFLAEEDVAKHFGEARIPRQTCQPLGQRLYRRFGVVLDLEDRLFDEWGGVGGRMGRRERKIEQGICLVALLAVELAQVIVDARVVGLFLRQVFEGMDGFVLASRIGKTHGQLLPDLKVLGIQLLDPSVAIERFLELLVSDVQIAELEQDGDIIRLGREHLSRKCGWRPPGFSAPRSRRRCPRPASYKFRPAFEVGPVD